ncbi:MAG: hypothetical protein RJA65_871 [Actinomycetota bacterium]
MFELPGFLTADALRESTTKILPRMANESVEIRREHNIYFLDKVDGLADDHPALKKIMTINHTLCGDQLVDTPVTTVYEWPHFREFVAATMGLRVRNKRTAMRYNSPVSSRASRREKSAPAQKCLPSAERTTARQSSSASNDSSASAISPIMPTLKKLFGGWLRTMRPTWSTTASTRVKSPTIRRSPLGDGTCRRTRLTLGRPGTS